MDRSQELKYLDDCIDHWRGIRDNQKHELSPIAIYYIDAFQSVRKSFFGDVKRP